MIGSIGSSSTLTQWASSLFSKLDAKNQGYIEKSDLQSALDGLTASGNSSGTASVDDVFGALDANGDGKVTEQEMSTSLQSLLDDLQSQLNSSRASGPGGMGGMPPPPPPPNSDETDAGYTQAELTSMAGEIGTSDSKLSNLISSIAANFEDADTNGDGKVNREEAMAFGQTLQSATSTSDTASATASSGASSTSSNQSTDALVMMRIMQLVRTYGAFKQDGSQSTASGALFAEA